MLAALPILQEDVCCVSAYLWTLFLLGHILYQINHFAECQRSKNCHFFVT